MLLLLNAKNQGENKISASIFADVYTPTCSKLTEYFTISLIFIILVCER